MYRAQYVPGVGWQGRLEPYGPLQLEPSAQVRIKLLLLTHVRCAGAHTPPCLQILNYGQGLFEGMKAQRTAQGKIVLFRPEENAARMQAGAAWRVCACAVQRLTGAHGPAQA